MKTSDSLPVGAVPRSLSLARSDVTRIQVPHANRGIVIAVDPDRGLFAVQAEDGRCAVFCQHAGPRVQAGDMLNGQVISRGARVLKHADGVCSAVGDTGPITRHDALTRIVGSMSAKPKKTA